MDVYASQEMNTAAAKWPGVVFVNMWFDQNKLGNLKAWGSVSWVTCRDIEIVVGKS